MDRTRLLARARERGVNHVVYWLARAVLQPFFTVYFRMERIGREHVPASGPLIIASNHRSFMDPFVIGMMLRRPTYFVAKTELFRNPIVAWLLSALGAFPVDRGQGDRDAMVTARAILERGDVVVIFPEGTRTRPGALGTPKRGVGRLALETGAPVVPVALIGTEAVRRGWRIRPHRVRIRAGRPLCFPQVDEPSPSLARAVTGRLWPCVELQWEWLGGTPPLRRAAIVGAGAWGTGLAVALARAGVEVELGCRTQEQVDAMTRAGVNEHYLPGVRLPDGVTVKRASVLALDRADLVCFAVPAAALPVAVGAHAEAIAPTSGVVVLSKGLVAPHGMLPSAYAAERVNARAVACIGGPGHAGDALRSGAALVVGSQDEVFAMQLKRLLKEAGFDVTTTIDVAGVELAGTAKNAAALAAAAAGVNGPNAAGAAAGKVFAEVDEFARRRGGRPETFAGLAGAGDLVATVTAPGSRNRRAGELLGQGVPAARIGDTLGQSSEALDGVGLLAATLRREGVPSPTLDRLAELVDGRIDSESFTAAVTAPGGRFRRTEPDVTLATAGSGGTERSSRPG
ncbi:MAG TPA: 1-acylglycerol-3-phosphate O-acyltransferase [Solirubrobacteraceae bacterium]|jgi:glycerol-3-phosphate dehydrogenase (NAD(P)+)|nr:1-acylglycerol-3-phosphate O-acyltransferase [Solirubrobacteraceae bacterium]